MDRECVLLLPDESNANVKYAGHHLDVAELVNHIMQGKLPRTLTMIWNDRLRFILTEDLQLKRLELLGVDLEAVAEDYAFDASVASELSQLILDIAAALGGKQPKDNT